MALQCNIDARGKQFRLAGGVVTLLAGVSLMFLWARPVGGFIPWTFSTACLAVGLFMVFEAKAGWCAIRAMGFRTKL